MRFPAGCAGCVVLALTVSAPVLAEGMQLGGALPAGRSLPYYPVPITSINTPAIHLPGPSMPVPGLPFPKSHVKIEVLPAGGNFLAVNLAQAVTLPAYLVEPGNAETVPADPAPRGKSEQAKAASSAMFDNTERPLAPPVAATEGSKKEKDKKKL